MQFLATLRLMYNWPQKGYFDIEKAFVFEGHKAPRAFQVSNYDQI